MCNKLQIQCKCLTQLYVELHKILMVSYTFGTIREGNKNSIALEHWNVPSNDFHDPDALQKPLKP